MKRGDRFISGGQLKGTNKPGRQTATRDAAAAPEKGCPGRLPRAGRGAYRARREPRGGRVSARGGVAAPVRRVRAPEGAGGRGGRPPRPRAGARRVQRRERERRAGACRGGAGEG